MPGRCAAPPAAAMMTSMPRPSALAAYSNIQSGVRCAETTRTSWGTSSSVNSSAARDMILQVAAAAHDDSYEGRGRHDEVGGILQSRWKIV